MKLKLPNKFFWTETAMRCRTRLIFSYIYRESGSFSCDNWEALTRPNLISWQSISERLQKIHE